MFKIWCLMPISLRKQENKDGCGRDAMADELKKINGVVKLFVEGLRRLLSEKERELKDGLKISFPFPMKPGRSSHRPNGMTPPKSRKRKRRQGGSTLCVENCKGQRGHGRSPG